MAATAAAARLERSTCWDPKTRWITHVTDTQRRSVLWHASTGRALHEAVRALGLSEATVRSHSRRQKRKVALRGRAKIANEQAFVASQGFC